MSYNSAEGIAVRTRIKPGSKSMRTGKAARRRRGKGYPYQSIESQFLAEHCKEMEQYAGEVLLIHGARLVAHSPDFAVIKRAIARNRIKSPFIYRVPEEDESNYLSIWCGATFVPCTATLKP
jgi:hypothetical protein